jgi:N4-gp56 family major capsid protein
MAGDTYLSTNTTNYGKSTVESILRTVQETLQGGLAYTPAGSVIPAALVPGSSGVFRSFGVSDLPEGGAVSVEDGQPDPEIEDLAIDFVEMQGHAIGRSIGVTDNAKARSPFNLSAIAVQKVSRDILVTYDGYARDCYKNAPVGIYGGTANSHVGDVAAGDKMTASILKDMVTILRGRDVKPLANGLYAFVASPYLLRDLMADDEYVDEMKFADPSTFLENQVVGRYAGAALINAGSRGLVQAGAGTGSIDVSIGVLIGANALFAALGGLQVIAATGPDKADPLNRRDVYSYKGFAAAILNDVQTERFVTVAVATSL